MKKKITIKDFYEYGVTIDDLPTEDIKLIAEIAGLDVALKLTIQFGGESIYFPKMDTLIVKKRNKAEVRFRHG
jgi:hypothetical protein